MPAGQVFQLLQGCVTTSTSFKSHNTNFTLGCDENGQPQEISPADFNSSCPYSGPPSDAKLATFYDFHEIKPGGEEIRYEPGTELLFRCVDIGKYIESTKFKRMIVYLPFFP